MVELGLAQGFGFQIFVAVLKYNALVMPHLFYQYKTNRYKLSRSGHVKNPDIFRSFPEETLPAYGAASI